MESTIAMKTIIYLGAAIIMVPLVRKIGLSSVIGYILGGIIIKVSKRKVLLLLIEMN